MKEPETRNATTETVPKCRGGVHPRPRTGQSAIRREAGGRLRPPLQDRKLTEGFDAR